MVDEQSEGRMSLEIHGFYPGITPAPTRQSAMSRVSTAGFNFPDQSPGNSGKPPRKAKLRYAMNHHCGGSGIERVPVSTTLINLGNRLYRESMDYAHLGCRHFVPCSEEELPGQATRVMAMKISRTKSSLNGGFSGDVSWDFSTQEVKESHEAAAVGCTSVASIQEKCYSSDMAVSQVTSESGSRSEQEQSRQEVIPEAKGFPGADDDRDGGEGSLLELLAEVAVQIRSEASSDRDLIKPVARFLHGEILYVQKRVRRCGRPSRRFLLSSPRMDLNFDSTRMNGVRGASKRRRTLPLEDQARCNQAHSPVTVKRVSRKLTAAAESPPRKETAADSTTWKVPPVKSEAWRNSPAEGRVQKKRKLSEVAHQQQDSSPRDLQSEDCFPLVDENVGAVVRSTRGRSQNLPARLQGSVLGAWKKGDRKKRS